MNKLFYLSDDEVQSQLAAKCDLLVHVGMETFQYAVIDAVRDRVKVLAEFDISELNSTNDRINAIESLPEATKLFKYSFNKIKVSFDTFNYTFIPSALFLDKDESEYGKFVKPEENSQLLINYIRSADIKNISAMDFELNAAVNRIFHNPRIFNQATSFVEGIKKIVNGDPGPSLFIDVQRIHIQIGMVKNAELIFYNIFDCISADEFNYYLLNVIEQLNIDTTQIQLCLSGIISEGDETYRRIQKYFNHIAFTDTRRVVKYAEKLEQVIPHTYFSLISLDLCE
ncbi:MAG: DUF3822 family protein [Daejeonella sp.]